MSGHASPATRFHDVLVTNDQTGAQWHAPVASIRNGLIVVAGCSPPDGFFGCTANTFTIAADDGGGRKRRFVSVTLARGAAQAGDEFAFT